MTMLRRCCCCFSVRNGCIIIGSLGIISCSLLIVSWSAYFHEVVKLLPLLIALMYSEQAVSDQDATDVSNDNPEARQAVAMAGVVIGVFAVIITVAVISLVIDILLVVGAAKGRKAFLLPWLVSQALSIVFHVGVFIALLVQSTWDAAGLSAVIAYIIVILFLVYFGLVVKSHHQDLREEALRQDNVPVEMQTRLTSSQM